MSLVDSGDKASERPEVARSTELGLADRTSALSLRHALYRSANYSSFLSRKFVRSVLLLAAASSV